MMSFLPREIEGIKNFLDTKFKIENVGDLKFFLGLRVARSNLGTFVSKKVCFGNAGLLGCKHASTPMDKSLKLSKNDGVPLQDVSAYH